MAVWLIRALDGSEPPAAAATRFADVDAGEWWAGHVERLAGLNITVGCLREPLRFCPDRAVTRAQMATLLVRTFGLAEAEPAGFADTEGRTHGENIDKLTEAGITAGCGQGRYCPDRHVTRAQMATLLARALKLVPLPGATPLASDFRLAYSTIVPLAADRNGWGNQIWMAGLQGSREPVVAYGFHGGDHPIFSPDGKWVAYGIDDRAFVMNMNSRVVREVRARGYWSFGFRWSPDSRHLAYSPAEGVGDTTWIEGSEGRNKRSQGGVLYRFSPDGKLALYLVYDEVDGERIYSQTVVENLKSGNRVNIEVDENNARYAVFTPDSQKVSWATQSPIDSLTSVNHEHAIWTMDVDGSNRVKLLSQRSRVIPGMGKIYWSPDGTRFVYTLSPYAFGSGFYVADVANEIFMGLGISKCNYMKWTSDGVHLISDNSDMFVFNTQTRDTISERDLYTGDLRYANIRNVRWSPDNQAFAYILEVGTPSDLPGLRYSNVTSQLWVADTNGQNKRILVEDNVGYDFRWSPDGTRIAYSILSPYGFEEHEGEYRPLYRYETELWITNSNGSDRWMVAQDKGISLLGWLPS